MKELPFGRPVLGEAEKRAVAEVLDGPILVHGPRAVQFEQEFASWNQRDGWFAGRPSPGLQLGDFGGDAVIDAHDIDLLAEQLRFPIPDTVFDLNGDSQVDLTDLARQRHSAVASTPTRKQKLQPAPRRWIHSQRTHACPNPVRCRQEGSPEANYR